MGRGEKGPDESEMFLSPVGVRGGKGSHFFWESLVGTGGEMGEISPFWDTHGNQAEVSATWELGGLLSLIFQSYIV